MDLLAWIVFGAAVAATIIFVAFAPLLKRGQLRQQLDGRGLSGGIGSGLDAVWRPSAEDAHAEWETQVELPAPAPAPGDKGRLQDGSIVIELRDEA